MNTLKSERMNNRKEERINFRKLEQINIVKDVMNTYPDTTFEHSRGFGDFLRGSIHLYRLSKPFKFNLTINLSEHPIGQYFEQSGNLHTYGTLHTEFMDWDIKKILHQDFSRRLLLKLLLEQNKCNVYFTEWWPEYFSNHMLEQNERDFIQSFLKPTMYIMMKVDSFIGDTTSFHILHIRTGDSQMIQDKSKLIFPELEFKLETYMNCIERHLTTLKQNNLPVILISDSFLLKRACAEKFKFRITEEMPGHSGMDFQTEGAAIEFVIMSKASTIFSISTYYWGSTFSKICSSIYNIPLIRLDI